MAVQATAVWRVRPSGSNTNGGGYDPGISGAATDYSQQNAAQATGTHGTATGTTTFIDATANAFTALMVGNCIQIASGAGFTPGFYFVTGFTSASTITLDSSPGTGTVAVWALGGGWADFTNCASTGPVVPGNTVFILGSGTPNPAAYVYDYTASIFTPAVGNASAGFISYNNDPSTPGYKAPPDTTGGMATIKTADTVWNGAQFLAFRGLWIVSSGATNPTLGVIRSLLANAPSFVFGCVYDQFGNDKSFITSTVGSNAAIIGCEVFSSSGGSGGTSVLITSGNAGNYIDGCNIHDTVGPPITAGVGNVSLTISNCIIAKCSGTAIQVSSSGYNIICSIFNNTIDGNTGHGILIDSGAILNYPVNVFNNIISNHTGVGKFGLSIGAGTAAVNDVLKAFVDYNVFYNNTANYNAISAGPHDTALGVTPYTASGTENYSLS